MRKYRMSARIIQVMCLLFLSSSLSLAQLDARSMMSSSPGGTTNFRFAEMNELTIVVSLLGEVQRPGRYEISRTINLLDLVALAGGWTPMADQTDVTITRIAENGSKIERKDLKFDLEEVSRVNDAMIGLQQNDFVRVGRLPGLTVDRVLTYVTTAAILVTTYITLVDRTKK